VSPVRLNLTKALWTILGAGAQAMTFAAFADTAQPATGHPFAAPQFTSQPATPSVTGLGQVTFALIVVLGTVFAIAWAVRRMRGFGNRVGSAIDVIADIPLGQKERAVLLKIGQTQILVGVAPGQVNTLHVLTEPIDLTKPTAGSDDGRPTFKSLMLRSLGK
jgi:flagellar protein FliO/FliZ